MSTGRFVSDGRGGRSAVASRLPFDILAARCRGPRLVVKSELRGEGALREIIGKLGRAMVATAGETLAVAPYPSFTTHYLFANP